MILMRPGSRIVTNVSAYKSMVEVCALGAGLCYNINTGLMTLEEKENFVRKRVKINHTSVIEHATMSVLFDVDRGVTHEQVRHRLSSFTQGSTRYCNYSDERFGGHVTFIIPPWLPKIAEGTYESENIKPAMLSRVEFEYLLALLDAEKRYMWFVSKDGGNWKAEQARGFLPHFTRAGILWTANMREWRHIFNLRALGTTGRPHPQMVEVMVPLFEQAKRAFPVFFEDMEMPECSIQ